GTSTDADVSVEDLNKLIQEIEKVNLPAIFIESTINPKLLQQLAHDKGIRIGGKLFADSLGEEDGEAGTYLKMMRHNTTQIVNGLTMSIGVAALKSYEWILLRWWICCAFC
ncbi:MAG: zinc ABC transporter substrate-binding protein, partial [Candidatus Neomarinimicrobiota bacterium]|nr:zinc ABC transporter substrate-binding protein [Candidatus Neomarinimicrobiota bacterium]